MTLLYPWVSPQITCFHQFAVMYPRWFRRKYPTMPHVFRVDVRESIIRTPPSLLSTPPWQTPIGPTISTSSRYHLYRRGCRWYSTVGGHHIYLFHHQVIRWISNTKSVLFAVVYNTIDYHTSAYRYFDSCIFDCSSCRHGWAKKAKNKGWTCTCHAEQWPSPSSKQQVLPVTLLGSEQALALVLEPDTFAEGAWGKATKTDVWLHTIIAILIGSFINSTSLFLIC